MFKVTVENMKYVVLHTSFGMTFDEATQMCKERNMKIYEPRDAVINVKVQKEIQKVTKYNDHWINIRRDDAMEE